MLSLQPGFMCISTLTCIRTGTLIASPDIQCWLKCLLPAVNECLHYRTRTCAGKLLSTLTPRSSILCADMFGVVLRPLKARTPTPSNPSASGLATALDGWMAALDCSRATW